MPEMYCLWRATLRAIVPACAVFQATSAMAEDATETAPLQIVISDPILVTAPENRSAFSVPLSSAVIADPTDGAGTPVLETGEFLRSIPGVTAARAGGHGFEPIIRGQQQNQLTVIDNGAQVYGACPGRMDPPTSLVRPGSYDSVTVIRGYQTVTNGSGASGGTILLDKPLPEMDQPISGSAWGGIDSNGAGTSAGLSLTKTHQGYFVSGDASWIRADNYEDGDGTSVRSAFNQIGGGLTMGYVDPDGSFLEGNLSVDRVRDALFNGMMDSPETDTIAARARTKVMIDGEFLRFIEASAYANGVDHVMDNYSLRSVSGMYMKTVSESDTIGGRIAATLDIHGATTQIGIDGKSNNRNALGYMGMSSTLDSVRTYSWPDVTISEAGLFGETTIPVAAETRIVAGARLDVVYTTAGAADKVPTTAVMGAFRTANSLYSDYYGTTYDDRWEVNAGGLVRLEHDLSDTVTLNVGVSRSVRTADATERGIASGYGAMARVGNPGIAPEKHHQVDIGASWSNAEGDHAFVAGYVNLVDDYITADRARGEYGVLRSDGALIYHNTDAFIGGIEAGGALHLSERWVVDGGLAWTYGEDLDKNRALAQIPPLSMNAGLTYQADGWSLGGTVRGALTQHRVDTDATTGTGQDVRETPGWVTLDIAGRITAWDPVEIGFGVTNLLDATYSNHLNKPATFEPEDIQVNEPGRSAYLKAIVRF